MFSVVFVRTRAEVAVLSHLLSEHPSTKTFRIAAFVGCSSFSGRKSTIGELVEARNQKDSLDDFRAGHKNLIVTTNALEEGIDVSACNVVICFDQPPNLKSFIQRRGRARKSASKYVVMFERGTDDSAISGWQDLEEEMKQIYMDEMRQLEELKNLESSEEGDLPPLTVQSTGYHHHVFRLSGLRFNTSQCTIDDGRVCQTLISFLQYFAQRSLCGSQAPFSVQRWFAYY